MEKAFGNRTLFSFSPDPSMKRRETFAVVAMVAAVLFLSCGNKQTATHIVGEAQGTYYSITYYDTHKRDLQPAIDSLLKDFDMTASLWVENSLLRRVNDGSDSIVNDCFATLLQLSTEMNNFTNGAFDCTIGKLVSAWGFSFKERQEMDSLKVAGLLQYCGRQPVTITDSTGRIIVRKPFKETTMDFNAIAQGYSTDLVCRFLEEKGIHDYIVDIGGEVYARGCKPDGTKWSVGIERPSENKYSAREVETVIELQDCAVVTSGSYRKYYEKEGVRYSHTIDPATGYPVQHTLLSVSVVDTAAWRADALATAFMVMGLEKALEFIASHPEDSGTQAVFFIYSDGSEYKTYATEGFRRVMSEL